MNVNFTAQGHIPNYSPNFKASFSRDNLTRCYVDKLAIENPTKALAVHNALKDIDSKDQILLRDEFGHYVAKNKRTGAKIHLSRDFKHVTTGLLDALTWNEKIKTLFGVKQQPKLHYQAYIENAKQELKPIEDSVREVTLHSYNQLLSDLIKERDFLNRKIDVYTKAINSGEVDVAFEVGTHVYDTIYSKK